jgi:hypothetical protein
VNRRATLARGSPHLPVDDPDAPGCCRICRRPTGVKNDMHELPPVPAAVREAEAARLGEREDDDQ